MRVQYAIGQEDCFRCKNFAAVWNLLKRNKFGVGENEINTTIVLLRFEQHTSVRTDTFMRIYSTHNHRRCVSTVSTVLLSPKFWSALFILLIKKSFH